MYLLVALFGDGFDWEELAGVILDAAEHDQCDFMPVLLEGVEDVFRAKDVFAGSGLQFQNGFVGVKPMASDLRSKCILNASDQEEERQIRGSLLPGLKGRHVLRIGFCSGSTSEYRTCLT